MKGLGNIFHSPLVSVFMVIKDKNYYIGSVRLYIGLVFDYEAIH